jgi:hypothetical protein
MANITTHVAIARRHIFRDRIFENAVDFTGLTALAVACCSMALFYMKISHSLPCGFS